MSDLTYAEICDLAAQICVRLPNADLSFENALIDILLSIRDRSMLSDN